MSKGIVTTSHLEDIADAIRGKLGSQSGYTPGQMAAAINSIPTGITPTGTISITQNGLTDVTQYAEAAVSVPNSYTQADEGKVVQSGALVAQTSETVTQNGTYDTTTKDEVVVDVQGGAPNLQDKTFTQNGTYTADTGYDGLGTVTVNVSGGGGSSGVYVGTADPDASIGSNGDYYYKRASTRQAMPETLSGTTQQSQAGYEFTVSEEVQITGLCGYAPSNMVANLYLCDTGGTILAQIDNASISGWTIVPLSAPVVLHTGVNYAVLIRKISGDQLKYSQGSHSPISPIQYVRGRYGTSFPGNAESGSRYGADVAVTGDYYKVTSEYFKENGAWTQI